MPGPSSLRVVVAPDSFSGTMSALEAAQAIASGWHSARPDDLVRVHPMSDGGLGLLDVIGWAHPAARRVVTEVADARGIATDATWLLLSDGTAVVETAQAVGLHDLTLADRDPARTTTYGVGQLLLAVTADPDVQHVVVGLGGSATVDGGVGMVSALTGHGVRREDGNGVKVGGRFVAEARSLLRIPRRGAPPMTVALDVDIPLVGPEGAARTFGPQKGADPGLVEELDAALTTWADVVEAELGVSWRDVLGAGAAGGMGFAMMALLGATPRAGAEVVAELTRLDLRHADVVVTGEGRLDAQTRRGKAPWLVASLARDIGAAVLAVAGEVHDATGFDDTQALGSDGLTDPTGAARDAAAALAGRCAPRLSRRASG